MAFEYDKLIGLIIEKYGTRERFAEAIDMAPQTLSLKLNGKSDWKRAEIIKSCEALGIATDSIPAYFFTAKIKFSCFLQ